MTRYPLVARTLDPVERLMIDQTLEPQHRGQTWYEIECRKCGQQFQLVARTLDAIVRRDGFVHCAYAECAERLWAVSAEEAQMLKNAAGRRN